MSRQYQAACQIFRLYTRLGLSRDGCVYADKRFDSALNWLTGVKLQVQPLCSPRRSQFYVESISLMFLKLRSNMVSKFSFVLIDSQYI